MTRAAFCLLLPVLLGGGVPLAQTADPAARDYGTGER